MYSWYGADDDAKLPRKPLMILMQTKFALDVPTKALEINISLTNGFVWEFKYQIWNFYFHYIHLDIMVSDMISDNCFLTWFPLDKRWSVQTIFLCIRISIFYNTNSFDMCILHSNAFEYLKPIYLCRVADKADNVLYLNIYHWRLFHKYH